MPNNAPTMAFIGNINEQFPATCPWIPNFLLPTDFQPSDSKFNLESGPFFPSCHLILQHVAFNNPTAQNLQKKKKKTSVLHVRSKIHSIESNTVPLSNLKISNLKSQYPTFFSFFIFVFLLKQRLPHLKAKPRSPFKEAKRKNNPTPFSTPRNSENSSAMRGQSNGGARGFASPDRGGAAGAHDKRGTRNNNSNNHHHSNNNNDYNKSGASSETAHDSKKGGSSSASGEAVAPPVVWPPKFAIALTNKEKEEDFLAIKGSKLPQRPKKRAKLIQRTVNLVSPGAWLCDLTLERYEVREKKITKKRPRGLKAMGNMESESD